MCIYGMCRIILRFIVSKEGKRPYFKKIEVLVKMPVPKIPQEIQVFNGMAKFYRCFIENFASIMAPITKLLKNLKCLNGLLNVKLLGRISKINTFKFLYLLVLTGNKNFMFTLMHFN